MNLFVTKLLSLIDEEMDKNIEDREIVARVLSGCTTGIISVFLSMRVKDANTTLDIWDEIDQFARIKIKEISNQEQDQCPI